MCYTSSYGLDSIYTKLQKLDWVKEIKPAVPTSGNGWGKNFKDYHLKKNYAIELSINGKLVHEWTFKNQSEAGAREVDKKYWDAFLEKADAHRKKVASEAAKEEEK